MCVDGLEETKDDPDVDGEDVQVLGKVAPEQRTADGSSAEDEHFSRVSVLGSEAKRRRVLVVQLMNVLVEQRCMQSLVGCIAME